MGNYNCIANMDERHGSHVRDQEIVLLRSCMNSFSLAGRHFTWSNKQGSKRVMSKTDRVLGNHAWLNNFPNVALFDHTRAIVHFCSTLDQNRFLTFFQNLLCSPLDKLLPIQQTIINQVHILTLEQHDLLYL